MICGALRHLMACGVLMLAFPAGAENAFSFGFVAHAFREASAGEAQLREILHKTDEDNLAFIVVAGIKAGSEPCSDILYERRKSLLDSAKNGVVSTIAASDWSDCRYDNGRSAAIERLNRLRELFYTGEFSFGGTRIPLIRQSASAKFRDYAEHARWEFGGIMFATLNLPANNNRYLSAAGRNNEFEDRLVASRYWLQRIATYAKRDKLRGIVIFSDGSPLARSPSPNQRINRDGFTEIRKDLLTLATRFPGRILIVHNQAAKQPGGELAIRWKDRLGDLGVDSGWVRVRVSPANPELFSIANKEAPATKN